MKLLSLWIGAVLAAAVPAQTATLDANPPASIGLVDWHASLAEARSAAAESGRPVLLFLLLGDLDREFC